jgi:hypothetical protein
VALVVFRSKAAGEIFMFAETTRRILDILGKDASAARGVITADEVAGAATRLQAAVDEEKAQIAAARQRDQQDDQRGRADPADEAAAARAVTLGQRAYPLLEMLRAAAKKKVEVTWGV